jgi:hypothetical protein
VQKASALSPHTSSATVTKSPSKSTVAPTVPKTTAAIGRCVCQHIALHQNKEPPPEAMLQHNTPTRVPSTAREVRHSRCITDERVANSRW